MVFIFDWCNGMFEISIFYIYDVYDFWIFLYRYWGGSVLKNLFKKKKKILKDFKLFWVS